jgi:MFS family permease
MFGAIIYIPVFAQGIVGVSATHSGLILTPMMIGLIGASSIAGQIISRTGRYKFLAIFGTAVTTLAMYWFSSISADTPSLLLTARMILLGIGLGSTMPIFTLAVQNAFARERLGEVTAGTQLFRSVGGTVGTAIFGGVMNSQLAARLADVGHEPFVQAMQHVEPQSTFAKIDANSVQAILNPDAQSAIRANLAQLPSGAQASITDAFNHFLSVIKDAFTLSLDHVYIVSMTLMALSFVIVCFLPEIAIRKSTRPVLEEVGIELEEELGQGDDESQH